MYYYMVLAINDAVVGFKPDIPEGINFSGYFNENQYLFVSDAELAGRTALTETELESTCDEWGLDINAVKSWTL